MTGFKYILIAYDGSLFNGYHFPVGVFDTREQAVEAAYDHHRYCGYKDSHVIHKVAANSIYDAGETEIVFDAGGVVDKEKEKVIPK